MKGPRRNQLVYGLLGVGLVLIGLLAGILFMLVVQDGEQAAAAPQVVERIQLGSPDPMRTSSRSDSAGARPNVDIRQLNDLFKEVASHVTPTVVYIQVSSRPAEGEQRGWFHNFDDGFFGDRMPRQSVGSGVIVSDDGYVVTNHHVVQDADDILVTLADKRQYEATVVGLDPTTDLAVIRLTDAAEVPVANLGDSDRVEVGEWVLAVGNPFRLTSTVTAGIVSALGRQVNIIGDSFGIEDFIQTDAAINPGNSGGALVNLDGELVGISTAIATESGSYEGYGFAVPVNLVERVVQDLIMFGEVQRGYLGVEIREVNARLARQVGLRDVTGVVLTNVWRDGAAFKGGLRDGDVVLTIDGRIVAAPNELQSAIARRRPGDRVQMEIWRDGLQQRFEVELLGRENPAYADWFEELEEEPAPPMPERSPHTEQPGPEIYEIGGWGLGVRDLSEAEREDFGVEDGAFVAYVENGGVVDRAGLPRGVVITRLAGEPVTSSEDVLDLFGLVGGTAETVLVRVQRRDGVTAFYELELPPAG